jgi:uncharacterized protein (TIGR03086 family)
MDVAELHSACVAVFVERVRLVQDGQWTLPTPCMEWTVRLLVNHMVAEELWTPPMMAGERIEEVGDRFAGDLLGADPVATAERAAPAAVRATIEPVRAGHTVHLSFGDTPAGEYAMQLAADHLIHAWDLSAAISVDRALPPELVEQIAGWFAEREAWYRQSGVTGERPDADDRGDRQRALLIAFGRDPDWAAIRAG